MRNPYIFHFHLQIKISTILLIFSLAECYHPFPQLSTNYHYKTLFPELSQYFESTVSAAPHPIRFNGEFNLKHPITFPSYVPLEDSFSLGKLKGRTYLPPSIPVNLFTPNTIVQPAETKGQIEEYNKALQEEARELEQQRNGVAMDVEGLKDPDIDESTNLRNYVSVKSREYNYNYFS